MTTPETALFYQGVQGTHLYEQTSHAGVPHALPKDKLPPLFACDAQLSPDGTQPMPDEDRRNETNTAPRKPSTLNRLPRNLQRHGLRRRVHSRLRGAGWHRRGIERGAAVGFEIGAVVGEDGSSGDRRRTGQDVARDSALAPARGEVEAGAWEIVFVSSFERG